MFPVGRPLNLYKGEHLSSYSLLQHFNSGINMQYSGKATNRARGRFSFFLWSFELFHTRVYDADIHTFHTKTQNF